MDLLNAVLRRWWLITAGILLGGLAGLVISLTIPPVYQTQAVISSGVDFVRTGRITDVEEDYMIKKVGDLIRSDEVMQSVLAAAAEQGLQLDQQSFDEMAFLQRSFTDWLLIVRSEDAGTAAQIANLWADAAWQELQEAAGHLTALNAYEAALAEQMSCRETQRSAGAGPVCTLGTFADLDAQIQLTQAAMQEEKLAARGLANGVLFDLTAHAEVPAKPVRFQRSMLAAAGALAGLVIAAVLVFIGGVKIHRRAG